MLQGTCPTRQTLEKDSCWHAEEWRFPGEGAGKKERGELLIQEKLPGICLVVLKITQDTSRLACPPRMPSAPSADSRGVGAWGSQECTSIPAAGHVLPCQDMCLHPKPQSGTPGTCPP